MDPADQQGGSQLAFAIANNTTQAQTYWVSFNVRDNSLPQGTTGTKVTVPAHTSIAKFITEILPASSNKGGWAGISPADGGVFGTGFSVMALRYAGAAFTTIPVSCYFVNSGSKKVKGCARCRHQLGVFKSPGRFHVGPTSRRSVSSVPFDV
jgi:hypothetical protein